MSHTIQALVRGLRFEAQDVISLTLEREDGSDLPPWTAGAHIDITLPTGVTRQYSLCGDPSSLRSYRVAILREPASRGGSEYVHMFLRPGQKVQIGEPRNHFALVDAAAYWFVAGGIGITPILSLAREVAGRAPSSVLYLGRGRSSLAFQRELDELDGFVTVHDSALKGRHDLSRFFDGLDNRGAVYACGSENLLRSVEELSMGWAPGVLHSERFKPRIRPVAPPTAFEIVWQPSGLTSKVPASRTALDVIEKAGLPVTGSCREGICGTCEVVVVDGIPDHRDDVVDDHTVAGGQRFFPCVSRAGSLTLTVRPS